MESFLSRLNSPLGELLLVTDTEQRVRALDFADHASRLRRGLRERHGGAEPAAARAPAGIAAALARYFTGGLHSLDDLPTDAAGSGLQSRVWAALRSIPSGSTTSYGRLARELGFDDPRAAIEIGAAIGANPIAIVVPCHRVIAGDGGLKGYAGGLHRKRWLLEHEKAIAPAPAVPRTGTLPGF
jgi:methylated-DNA-[protein]-cysteine S-methyltransferase